MEEKKIERLLVQGTNYFMDRGLTPIELVLEELIENLHNKLIKTNTLAQTQSIEKLLQIKMDIQLHQTLVPVSLFANEKFYNEKFHELFELYVNTMEK